MKGVKHFSVMISSSHTTLQDVWQDYIRNHMKVLAGTRHVERIHGILDN